MNWNRSESPLPADLAGAIARAAPRLHRFGNRIHYFASVGSTNDVARAAADAGAPEGTVVVAGMQTAGRGRRGHEWFSPASAGLYVSIVHRPATWHHAGGTMLVTVTTAIALVDAIATSTGLRAHIKWPNDVLLGRRKVAGILAEASGGGSAIDQVIVGYGINLARVSYPPPVDERATSLEQELGRAPDRGAVFAESLASLALWHAHLGAGHCDAILRRWRELSPSSLGATVEWATPSGILRGTTAGIDDDGALRVATAGGIERITGGEVIWRD